MHPRPRQEYLSARQGAIGQVRSCLELCSAGNREYNLSEGDMLFRRQSGPKGLGEVSCAKSAPRTTLSKAPYPSVVLVKNRDDALGGAR